ncbi:hypothetical protein D6C99_07364, partial [Aureobasidium pullulans]
LPLQTFECRQILEISPNGQDARTRNLAVDVCNAKNGIIKYGVYCDETHPECKSCLRFRVRCSFKDVPSEACTPGSQTETTPDIATSTSDQGSDNTLDLELMANIFLGPLHDLFRGQEEKGHEFIKEHTALLFSKRYLLHQVLAMSGLHLFSQDRSRLDVYLRSSYHQKEALNLAQPHIGSAAEDHSLAMFLFAGYTASCASAEMVFSQNHEDDNPIDITVHAWGLSRGIVIISTLNWSYIQSSWAWPIIQQQIDVDSAFESRPKDIPAYSMVRALAFGVQPAEDRQVCLNAIEHTFRAISLLQQCTDQQLWIKLASSWPIEIDARLDGLVTERHPVALVIMAYYACMLSLVSELWWVGAWPQTLLRHIVDALGDEWTEFLQWPMEILTHTQAHTPVGSHPAQSTPSG